MWHSASRQASTIKRISVAFGVLVVHAWLTSAHAQVPVAWRDPSPHDVRWTTVDSSVRLEVLDWRGSGPPLVLIACYLTAHSYDDFAPHLTNQFHVYGITRRGIGASDKPMSGYSVQRSADDLLETLDALNLRKIVLVGTSCAGQVQTLFAAQHADRLSALVYFDGASDPTITGADVNSPMPDLNTLPRLARSPAIDRSSFAAFRLSRQRLEGIAFPEAEWRQEFAENPDGTVGESLMSLPIRRAITTDARMKPDFTKIHVPVLALYQAQRPFDDVASEYDIRNEQERAALRQEYESTNALYARWKHDLLTAVPAARVVDLVGANVYMFASKQDDVLREIRSFVATLPRP